RSAAAPGSWNARCRRFQPAARCGAVAAMRYLCRPRCRDRYERIGVGASYRVLQEGSGRRDWRLPPLFAEPELAAAAIGASGASDHLTALVVALNLLDSAPHIAPSANKPIHWRSP